MPGKKNYSNEKNKFGKREIKINCKGMIYLKRTEIWSHFLFFEPYIIYKIIELRGEYYA